jgi:hypothetical protein
MYKDNTPEVPTLNWKVIIPRIEKKICALTEEEEQDIKEWLEIHGCEPMAAAERISELLEVDYHSILDLL